MVIYKLIFCLNLCLNVRRLRWSSLFNFFHLLCGARKCFVRAAQKKYPLKWLAVAEQVEATWCKMLCDVMTDGLVSCWSCSDVLCCVRLEQRHVTVSLHAACCQVGGQVKAGVHRCEQTLAVRAKINLPYSLSSCHYTDVTSTCKTNRSQQTLARKLAGS